MKRNIASLIAFAASTALAFSQVQIKVGSALKISESITIDGALSEAVWQGAQDFTDFIQFEPERGKPASLKTTVRILYDERNIYLGFLCYDPKPELLAASQSKRDSDLRIDDSVAVCLDTFYDKRNCYYFMTNLLGAQYDGRIAENGLRTDATWDGVWKSAGRKTDFGWSAEIAIELSSLKYEPGTGAVWGLTLGYDTREWESAEVTYSFGKNFDLDFQLVEGKLNYKISRDFALEYGLTRLVFNPDPEKESTWIHVIRATNYFTKDLFLKVFCQVNSAIDKHNIQVLFVYRFQPPFGLVQLAYQKGTARFGEKGTQGNTLFFKIANMF